VSIFALRELKLYCKPAEKIVSPQFNSFFESASNSLFGFVAIQKDSETEEQRFQAVFVAARNAFF